MDGSLKQLTSKEIYDLGYAIPCYDISTVTQTFRYRDEEYTLPFMAVEMHEIPRVRFWLARIEDVRRRALQ